MNKWLQANKQLLIMQQVLTSRLAIRDFFLKTTVREVYENIGQVLSLVRMQLATAELKVEANARESIQHSGNLVGQSIRDLRSMCKSFYPDDDITKEDGFIHTFKKIIAILFSNRDIKIKMEGIIKEVEVELKLIVFNILQDIVVRLKESDADLESLEINFEKNEIKFCLYYKGNEIEWKEECNDVNLAELTIEQKLQLIKGRMVSGTDKDGSVKIEIVTPLKVLSDV